MHSTPGTRESQLRYPSTFGRWPTGCADKRYNAVSKQRFYCTFPTRYATHKYGTYGSWSTQIIEVSCNRAAGKWSSTVSTERNGVAFKSFFIDSTSLHSPYTVYSVFKHGMTQANLHVTNLLPIRVSTSLISGYGIHYTCGSHQPSEILQGWFSAWFFACVCTCTCTSVETISLQVDHAHKRLMYCTTMFLAGP